MTGDSELIGRTLGGRFRITGFIGEGAMATVYRAEQDLLPNDVAVKIMHPHLTADRTFVARFRREAKAAAAIVHPNTVRIFDTGVDGELLYIAMELLGGKDLFDILVLERRLSELRAARILIQVADALVAAHGRGIVHRDLKPENIMILPDLSDPDLDRVKVLDFGIAKVLDRESPNSSDQPQSMQALTTVGTVVGTPAYMSPEQCRGETIDHRSDLYAAGVVLYQLVCGRLPFLGDHAMDFAVKHVKEDPTPPSQVVSAIHPGLEALLLKALSKWPAQRQADAAELRAELTALLPELAKRPHVPDSAGGSVRVLVPAGNSGLPNLAGPPSSDNPLHDMPTLAAAPAVPAKPAAAPPPILTTLSDKDNVEIFRMSAELAAARKAAPAAPAPAPPPAAITLPVPAAPPAKLRPARRSELKAWLIVPVALVLGIAVGALAFHLMR